MNIIDPINLVDGLNINPIPLEFSQSMTTTKLLLAMQAKLNEVIIIRNDVINEANGHSDTKYNLLVTELNTLENLLHSGEIIPNGSVGIEKLKDDFIHQFDNLVVDTVENLAQFVSFGLNDEGCFVAFIPKSWNEINFSTDIDGHLVLKF